MTFAELNDIEFIDRLTEIVLANLQDENLYIQELASGSGMTPRALNKRLYKIKKQHSNQFINEVRLHKSLELLQNTTLTVAEIAFRTGFSSPAYFTKCFHKQYGYPPGQFKNSAPGALAPADDSTANGIDEPAQVTNKLKPVYVILMTLALLGAGTFFVYRYLFHSDNADAIVSEDGRISLVVFPFRNLTKDSSWDIWQDGIQSEIVSSLSNNHELEVRHIESVNKLFQIKGLTNYAAITPSVASDISGKLDAKVYISGNIMKAGDAIRVNVQIVNSRKGEVLKSYELFRPAREEMIFQVIDSLKLRVKNFLINATLKKENPGPGSFASTPDFSPEAYRYYLSGTKAFLNHDYPTAADMYLHALKIDSTLPGLYRRIAGSYLNQRLYEQGKPWLLRWYKQHDTNDINEDLRAHYEYARYFQTPDKALGYAEQLIALDDQDPASHFRLADTYWTMGSYDKAIPAYEKALEIYRKWGTKPPWIPFYTYLGLSYHYTGKYEKEKKLYKKAQEDFPDDLAIMDQFAVLALTERDTVTANRWIKKFIAARREKLSSDADIANYMAYFSLKAGSADKAEKYYRQSLALEPGKPGRMAALAYFLIDQNRNYREGLALIDSALKTDPGNYSFLHVKGWGLYKLGKKKEAVEVLKKSWDLRLEKAEYEHTAWLHLEEVKKTVARSKQ